MEAEETVLRKASQAWIDLVASVLGELGFDRSAVAPWFYVNRASGCYVEVHMDDFHVAGAADQLTRMLGQLRQLLVIKATPPMVAGAVYTHLKRLRVRREDGTWIQADTRYIQAILEELGLTSAREVSSPMAGELQEDVADETPLEAEWVYKYRRCVGIALYLSTDREDIAYPVKELARRLRDPKAADLMALKRLGRYLKGTAGYGVWLPKAGSLDRLECVTDSNWANCKMTRKSTTGCHLSIGDCVIAGFSRTQSLVSLSSGESEYYAAVTGASEGLFLRQILSFLLVEEVPLHLFIDATAAKGICTRLGVGKIRHLEAKTLWLQRQVKDGVVQVFRRPGVHNVADISTKAVQPGVLERLLPQTGLCTLDRAGELPEVHAELAGISRSGKGSGGKREMGQALLQLLGLWAGLSPALPVGANNSHIQQSTTTTMHGIIIIIDDTTALTPA